VALPGGVAAAYESANQSTADDDEQRATKRYVGAMKATPASRTPRKFTIVTRSRMPRQIDSVCGCKEGMAEMSAPTPAEMPTAAVRM